jgi:hypothetical protein
MTDKLIRVTTAFAVAAVAAVISLPACVWTGSGRSYRGPGSPPLLSRSCSAVRGSYLAV